MILFFTGRMWKPPSETDIFLKRIFQGGRQTVEEKPTTLVKPQGAAVFSPPNQTDGGLETAAP
jgi:hypothetical protein